MGMYYFIGINSCIWFIINFVIFLFTYLVMQWPRIKSSLSLSYLLSTYLSCLEWIAGNVGERSPCPLCTLAGDGYYRWRLAGMEMIPCYAREISDFVNWVGKLICNHPRNHVITSTNWENQFLFYYFFAYHRATFPLPRETFSDYGYFFRLFFFDNIIFIQRAIK